MARLPLTEDMTIEELISVMSEGDSHAVHVLNEIIAKNSQAANIIMDMDDMNIRGPQITIGVKDCCLGSIKRFVQMVYNRSPWLVDELNKEWHANRTVTEGASFSKDR